jgi:ankyrin repeat protein
VCCQLETLRHCLPPSVRLILSELPETLDETYERVLREIHKANREHALRLLQCLTVAVRPLRVEELADVLAVDFDTARQDGIPKLNPDWRWEGRLEAVFSTCSNLIVIADEDGTQVVQFSHFSVKEFLTSERLAISSGDISRYHIVLEPAHTILAQACLGVLLRLDNRVDETKLENLPLVEYAARHWVEHAQFENVSSNIRDAMKYFFDVDKPHWAAWIQVYDIDIDDDWNWVEWFDYSPGSGGSPLYYASLCGFHDLVEYLIAKHPVDVTTEGGQKKTPLVAALSRKYFRVAELLHQHDEDVDVRDEYNRTPLYIASRLGCMDVAEWLVNHGADVNAKQNDTTTPLSAACFEGYFKIVRILLDHKAHVSARDDDGCVALHHALTSWRTTDRLDIVRLLLEYGTDVNARDNRGMTPLHRSLSHWRMPSTSLSLAVMRLLLKYGANINSEDNEGRTALQMVSAKGCHELAEFLSENGAK